VGIGEIELQDVPARVDQGNKSAFAAWLRVTLMGLADLMLIECLTNGSTG